MTFTGNEDHSISLEDASKLTANYQKNAGANDRKAGFFGKSAIHSILDQDDCVGIRIYFGQDEDGVPELVLVGAKADMDDIVNGVIAEKMIPCPPNCSSENALISD